MEKIWIVFLGIICFGLTSALYEIETEKGEKEELFSEKDICELMKGCWDVEECFPNGYRKDDIYCGWKQKLRDGRLTYYESVFITQKNVTEQCNNSFECKSNFCFDEKCVGTLNVVEKEVVDGEIVRIDKSDLEELRNIVEDVEKSMEGDYSEEVSKDFFGSLIGLFKRMFDW